MREADGKPQAGDVIFIYSGGKDGFFNVALQKWKFDSGREKGPWFSHAALALDDQIAIEASTAPLEGDPPTWSGSQLTGGVRMIALPDLLFASKDYRVLRNPKAATLPDDTFAIEKPYISGLYGSKYSIQAFEDYMREKAPVLAFFSDATTLSTGWTSEATDAAHEIGDEFRSRVLKDFPQHKFALEESTYYCSDLVRVILSAVGIIPKQDRNIRITPSALFDQLSQSGFEDVTDRCYSQEHLDDMARVMKISVQNHYDSAVRDAHFWSGKQGFDDLWAVVEKQYDHATRVLDGHIDNLMRMAGASPPSRENK